jgi:methylmalonyl-CoA mutase
MAPETSEQAPRGDFPPVTHEDWVAQVATVLRRSGRDADDPQRALSTALLDGPTVRPLYTAADVAAVPATGNPGAFPYTRGASAQRPSWDVRASYADPDPSRTNAAVHEDLDGGVTSLWLSVGDTGIAVDDLPAALEGVPLDRVPIALDAGVRCDCVDGAARALLDLAGRRGVDPARLTGTFGADPIGLGARTGTTGSEGLDVLSALVETSTAAPKVMIATVDGTVYHDAGASDVAELAITTAVGVAYLRALARAGVPVDEALDRIEFRLAVTDDQFASIAKLRAARRVWGRVAQLCGASPDLRGQRQHAVTSAAMLTRRDPWVNLLRTTIGCFAAVTGGADSITVLPFDHAIGRPDEFARRIARNTSAILHDESSLGRVLDPGGGSWYLESLTNEFARAAWDRFTAIERGGGAAAYVGGPMTDDLAATRRRREDRIAHRQTPITGVSEFAYLDEKPVTRPAAPAASASGTGVAAPHRYAEAFESLRDRAESAANRPTVFLAALGTAAAHTPRVGFATNLFAAGGIRAVTGTGSTDEIVQAFRDSGSPLVCLCGSDDAYAQSAGDLATALRTADAEQVWLTGEADVPGVDAWIFTGCDALEALRTAFGVLEVPE